MAVDATNNLDICDMEAGTLAVEEILGDSDPRFDISGHSSAGLLSTSKPAGDGSMDCKMSLGRKRKLNAEELEDGELIEEASQDEVVKSTESNGQCGNGRNFNKINKYLPLDRGAGHGSWKKVARRTTGVIPEYHNDLETDYSMSQHKMSPRMIEPTDDLKMALLETQSGQPTRTSIAFSGRYSVLKEMKLTEAVNLIRAEKVPNARMRLSTVCKYIGKEKNHEIDLRFNEQKTPNSNVALEYKLESDSSPAKYKDRNGVELLDHRSSYANIVSSDKISVLSNDLANVQAPEKDDSQRFLTEPSREVCVAPLLHDIWRVLCFSKWNGENQV